MNNETTIYDNEKTEHQYHDEEATQYDTTFVKNKEKSASPKTELPKNNSIWKKAATGMGSGILLGTGAMLFSSGTTLDELHGEEDHYPEWTDGKVPIATSTDDNMSFSEAFGTARMEVGSGGVFEWNGNIYSTYTENEWNGMTAEEKAEYANHFSWHNDSMSAHSSSSTSSSNINEVEIVEVNNSKIDEQTETDDGEELEITGVIPETGEDEVNGMSSDSAEVEILGVMHDNELGTNIGGLVVDGQEFVLIDVDGDGTFDIMGRDLDGDQQVTQEELVDISEHHLTINDMGGMSMTDDLYTSDNGVDYIDDVNIL